MSFDLALVSDDGGKVGEWAGRRCKKVLKPDPWAKSSSIVGAKEGEVEESAMGSSVARTLDGVVGRWVGWTAVGFSAAVNEVGAEVWSIVGSEIVGELVG